MSEMTLTQAADEVKKMLRGFRAVEQVSAALEQVGSLQNAGKEAEKHLESLKADIATTQDNLVSAGAEVTKAKEEAKKIAADAKEKAANKLEKANADAACIVADAQAIQVEAEAKCAATSVRKPANKMYSLKFLSITSCLISSAIGPSPNTTA